MIPSRLIRIFWRFLNRIKHKKEALWIVCEANSSIDSKLEDGGNNKLLCPKGCLTFLLILLIDTVEGIMFLFEKVFLLIIEFFNRGELFNTIWLIDIGLEFLNKFLNHDGDEKTIRNKSKNKKRNQY